MMVYVCGMTNLLLASPIFFRFLQSHRAPGSRASAQHLHETWKEFATVQDSPLAAVGMNAFGRAMASTEFEKVRTKAGNVYLGLKV